MHAHGSCMHQKCSNLKPLTKLLFGLCRFMWIIDSLVTYPSPHPRTSTHHSIPKVLQIKKHTPTPSIVSIYGFTIWIFQGVWGCFKKSNQVGSNSSKETFYEVGSKFYKSNKTTKMTNRKQIYFGSYKLCNQVGRGKATQNQYYSNYIYIFIWVYSNHSWMSIDYSYISRCTFHQWHNKTFNKTIYVEAC